MAFLLDTTSTITTNPRGVSCFMCLKPISPGGAGPNGNGNGSSSLPPFQQLTRYLGVEEWTGNKKGLQQTQEANHHPSSSLSPAPVGVDNNGAAGLGVGVPPPPPPPLCSGCANLTQQFSKVYTQLEVIRLQAEACVARIHGVMKRAEEHDVEGLLWPRWSTESENLRQEVVQKCSSFLSKRSPRVRLAKLAKKENNIWKNHHLQKNPCSTTTTATGGISSARTQQGGHQFNCQKVVTFCDRRPPGETAVVTKNKQPPRSNNVFLALGTKRRRRRGRRRAPVNSEQPEPVSFRRLPGNKDSYECGICFKVLRRVSLFGHNTLFHGGGDQRFPCAHCTKTFRYQANLAQHNSAEHRSSFFSKYQDPHLTSEQFERVTVELFKGLQVRQLGPRSFSCPYCASVQQTKGRVIGHVLRRHLEEELLPRLVALQKGYSPGVEAASASLDICEEMDGESVTFLVKTDEEDLHQKKETDDGMVPGGGEPPMPTLSSFFDLEPGGGSQAMEPMELVDDDHDDDDTGGEPRIGDQEGAVVVGYHPHRRCCEKKTMEEDEVDVDQQQQIIVKVEHEEAEAPPPPPPPDDDKKTTVDTEEKKSDAALPPELEEINMILGL